MAYLTTEEKITIHPSTKVFEGIDTKTMTQAENFAKESRSYIFRVYRLKNVPGRRNLQLFFYGYGIPK